MAHLAPLLDRVAARVNLSDEERLILTMVYRDGFKKTQVAASPGLPEHQPGRLLKRVFARIAQAINAVGLDLDVLRN